MRGALKQVRLVVAALLFGSVLFLALLVVLVATGSLCIFECAGKEDWAGGLFETAWPLVPILVFTGCVACAAALLRRRRVGR